MDRFPEQRTTNVQLWSICSKSRFPAVTSQAPCAKEEWRLWPSLPPIPLPSEPPRWPFQNQHLYEFLLSTGALHVPAGLSCIKPVWRHYEHLCRIGGCTGLWHHLSCLEWQGTSLSQAALTKRAEGIMTASLLILSNVSVLALGWLRFLISSDMFYLNDCINQWRHTKLPERLDQCNVKSSSTLLPS